MKTPAASIINVCLFTAFLFCLLQAGCGSGASEEIVIISPHSPEIRAEFSRGFSDWYEKKTGIRAEVKWLDVGGTGEAIKYIESRYKSNPEDVGVDIFFGGGDYPFIKLKGKELLRPCPLPEHILKPVPEELNGVPVYQKDYSWYGAALSGFGIVYNKEILKRNDLPVPLKWEDLGKDECFGWVASGDPRYSGSIHLMYEVLLQAYGWEKGWEVILKMGSNVQTFTKGGSSAAKDVSIGQAAYGLAIDFYAFIEILRYGGERLGFVLPADETVVTPDGIGLIKGGYNPKGAEAFLEYVMSEGQKLWLYKTGVPGGPADEALCRFPVRKDLYQTDRDKLAVKQNPYEGVQTIVYDGRKGGIRWQLVEDMIASFVITPHEDLKECRKKMIEKQIGRDEIFRVDLTEEEASELAGDWSKPDFALRRIQKMNEWTERARARYRSVD